MDCALESACMRSVSMFVCKMHVLALGVTTMGLRGTTILLGGSASTYTYRGHYSVISPPEEMCATTIRRFQIFVRLGGGRCAVTVSAAY
jgi:hypothetical protein